MGGDLLREGDDAHDRRDDDVHRVVLDRVGVDASILQLEDSGRDPEGRRRLGGAEGLAGDDGRRVGRERDDRVGRGRVAGDGVRERRRLGAEELLEDGGADGDAGDGLGLRVREPRSRFG